MLEQYQIPFEQISERTVKLSPAVNLPEAVFLNSTYQIQDLSSQAVIKYLPSLPPNATVWDCCAGSGGKSLLLLEKYQDLNLTVSDVRQTILKNLEKRIKGIAMATLHVELCDLEKDNGVVQRTFDLILADVPCTGSGTWGRTPEYLTYFDEETIDTFASRQRMIIKNAVPNLKKGGYLIYITCSAYKQENEENANFLAQEHRLQIEQMQVLTGYENKADTMFVCVFKKN